MMQQYSYSKAADKQDVASCNTDGNENTCLSFNHPDSAVPSLSDYPAGYAAEKKFLSPAHTSSADYDGAIPTGLLFAENELRYACRSLTNLDLQMDIILGNAARGEALGCLFHEREAPGADLFHMALPFFRTRHDVRRRLDNYVQKHNVHGRMAGKDAGRIINGFK